MSFIFFAIGVSMIVAAVSKGVANLRRLPPPAQQMLADPRVNELQSEVDELRAQVERLAAAESFYAQLRAPAPATPQAPPAPQSDSPVA
jgi:hypothetical protein